MSNVIERNIKGDEDIRKDNTWGFASEPTKLVLNDFDASGKFGYAPAHTMSMGDATMSVKKEKSFKLNFVVVEDRSEDIIVKLAKREIQKVLAKHGAVSNNLDEVISKSITGEMRYGEIG